ncbi:hypothetical protein Q2379_26190, partial [Escherichia coli]|nr:hypothetical protein [Escherichia coli]
FFFSKQKTAYEIHERLVGAEMCKREKINRICFLCFFFGEERKNKIIKNEMKEKKKGENSNDSNFFFIIFILNIDV